MASNYLKERLKNRPKTDEHSVGGFFTGLQEDLELLDALVDRYNEQGARTCKSEVIRVALRVLDETEDGKALERLCEIPRSSQGPKKRNQKDK